MGEGKEDAYDHYYGFDIVVIMDVSRLLQKKTDIYIYISLIPNLLGTEDIDTRGQSQETQEGIR